MAAPPRFNTPRKLRRRNPAAHVRSPDKTPKSGREKHRVAQAGGREDRVKESATALGNELPCQRSGGIGSAAHRRVPPAVCVHARLRLPLATPKRSVSAVKGRPQNPACSVRAMISPCRAGVKSQK